jgi:hypothetical protein
LKVGKYEFSEIMEFLSYDALIKGAKGITAI